MIYSIPVQRRKTSPTIFNIGFHDHGRKDMVQRLMRSGWDRGGNKDLAKREGCNVRFLLKGRTIGAGGVFIFSSFFFTAILLATNRGNGGWPRIDEGRLRSQSRMRRGKLLLILRRFNRDGAG